MPSFEVADTLADAMAGCAAAEVVDYSIVMVVARTVVHTQVVVVSSCPSLSPTKYLLAMRIIFYLFVN